jgi:hypothetical protein
MMSTCGRNSEALGLTTAETDPCLPPTAIPEFADQPYVPNAGASAKRLPDGTEAESGGSGAVLSLHPSPSWSRAETQAIPYLGCDEESDQHDHDHQRREPEPVSTFPAEQIRQSHSHDNEGRRFEEFHQPTRVVSMAGPNRVRAAAIRAAREPVDAVWP